MDPADVCRGRSSRARSPLAQSAEPVDLDAITRIKAEGFERSQVMDMAWWLTEVHGPRLTNSPQMRAAADWTVKKLTEWGLANVEAGAMGRQCRVRPRLEQRAHRRARVKPSPWPVLAYARGVDAGHQRRGHRGRRAGADRDGGGLRQVPRQAQGQDRAAAGAARGSRRCSSAGAPLHAMTTSTRCSRRRSAPPADAAGAAAPAAATATVHREAQRVPDRRRRRRRARAGKRPRRQRQPARRQRRLAQPEGSAGAAATGGRDRTLQPHRPPRRATARR